MKYIVLFLFLLGFAQANADEWNSSSFSWSQTISEISNNIKQLDADKQVIKDEKKEFLSTYRFNKYFKRNLSFEDTQNIKTLINSYNIENNALERSLKQKLSLISSQESSDSNDILELEDIKTSILLAKKDLYKSLTPYVAPLQHKQYLDFIQTEITSIKKTKDVSSKIVIQKVKLVEKVNTIEEKIQENNKKLNDDILKLIQERISIKIKEFKENPKFKKLSYIWKIKVLDITLRKIQIRIQNLDNNTIDTSSQIIQRKKQTYQFIYEEIDLLKREIEISETINQEIKKEK